jgi:hypothetical protein
VLPSHWSSLRRILKFATCVVTASAFDTVCPKIEAGSGIFTIPVEEHGLDQFYDRWNLKVGPNDDSAFASVCSYRDIFLALPW